MSQQALAAALGISHSDVSRREGGKQGLTPDGLAAHLDALKVEGADREVAVALHRGPNMIAGVQKPLAMLAHYEDAAMKITNVQPGLIPGPLQTREWSLELGRRAGLSVGEAERGADFRAERAEKILGRGVPFEGIIGEYALRYPACAPHTAWGQLRRLVELSRLPQVTIRVVPMSSRYAPFRAGSFVLMQLEQSAVVHVEEPASSTTLTDARYVNGYQDVAANLRSEAMSPVDTTRLIAHLIDEMERT